MSAPHLEKLLESFPEALVDNKQGKSYIGHEHIRLRVIDATGNSFDWIADPPQFRTDGVVSLRTDKKSGEQFEPLVMIVTGRLTIPGLGTRTGMGVQVLEHGMGEDGYKMAESDAFKRAAMAFGVALEQLYVNGGKAKQAMSSHPATPRPQTQQHEATMVAAQPQMTHVQFGEAVQKAVDERRGDDLLHLVDEAGTLIARWVTLVKASPTSDALEWIVRQIERRQIADPVLLEAITKQQAELGLTPSTGNGRRDNVLPGMAADAVAAGKASADRYAR